MPKAIFYSFFGYCVGIYIPPTIVLLGVTVPWALVGLGISFIFAYALPLTKKIWRFLWKQFIQAVRNELLKN